MWILRAGMLLSLIVWIGGIIFFALVLAPTLFTVLSPELAGNVVSPSLTRLHSIGLVAGAVFLACSLVYNRTKYAQLRLFSATHVLLVLMLLLTALSQFVITPRLRELRSGPAGLESPDIRADFDRLHAWSARTESGVLLMGLIVVVTTARRFEKGN